MADFDATPNATVSITSLTSDSGTPTTANAHLKITDSNDGTWLSQVNGSTTGEAIFTTSAAIGGAQSIDSVSSTLRCQLDGTWSDDTLQIWSKFLESNGSTALTDEVMLFDASTMSGAWEENTIAHNLVTTDVARWTGHQIKLWWVYSKSKGADNITLRIAQADFPGTYTAAPIGAEDVNGAGVVEKAALTQTHILGAEDVNNAPVVESGGVVMTHPLEALSLGNTGVVQSGGVTHTHALAAKDLSSSNTVQSGRVDTVHSLGATNLRVDFNYVESVGLPVLIRMTWPDVYIGGDSDILTCKDVGNTGFVSSGAIGVTHNLTCRDVDAAGVVQPGQIEPTHNLTVKDVDSTHVVQSGSLGGSHVLSAADINAAGEIQRGAVDTEHALACRHINSVGEVQPVELAPVANPPAYGDLTSYINEPVMVDLSLGWANHDPNGFTADQLPTGIVLSAQGMASGTPTTLQAVTVTIFNSGGEGSFLWTIIPREPPEDGGVAETNQQHLGVFVQIGVN